MPEAAPNSFIVTLTNDRPLADVTRDLAAHGFALTHALEAIGVLTGSASPETLSALRAIPGIADISPDHDVHTCAEPEP